MIAVKFITLLKEDTSGDTLVLMGPMPTLTEETRTLRHLCPLT
jgi:hypothetical protein